MKKEESVTEAINNSTLVQAAITEAVHRYYYDRIIKDDFEPGEREIINNLQASLWNLMPDWRGIIHEKAKRYFDGGRIKIVPLINKPIERAEIFSIHIMINP